VIDKLKKRWKDVTIALALPMMVVNTALDYYSGWESRTESRIEDYRLRWFILAHEHDEDGEVDWIDLREKGYGDMIPSPTDSFTPEVKADSYLSKIFQPIKNQVDRFSNWWRGLFKKEMLKDIRG
tara:strand:+ start:39 stop:413 length:375 start_codon:yes stop_codon:yes gene_type:complete